MPGRRLDRLGARSPVFQPTDERSTTMLKPLLIAALAALMLAATASAGSAATPASSAATIGRFDGRILSINRVHRTFSVRDLEKGTVRIKVTNRTTLDRLAGFSSLRRSLLVDVTARRSAGRWLATSVGR